MRTYKKCKTSHNFCLILNTYLKANAHAQYTHNKHKHTHTHACTLSEKGETWSNVGIWEVGLLVFRSLGLCSSWCISQEVWWLKFSFCLDALSLLPGSPCGHWSTLPCDLAFPASCSQLLLPQEAPLRYRNKRMHVVWFCLCEVPRINKLTERETKAVVLRYSGLILYLEHPWPVSESLVQEFYLLCKAFEGLAIMAAK